MDEQRNLENRLALIGLTVLVTLTVIVFAFVFLDAGQLFSGSQEEAPGLNASTDTDAPDADRIAEEIAAARTAMNGFQTQLDSPYLLLINEQSPIPEGYTVELAPLNSNGALHLDKAAASAMNAFLSGAQGAGFDVSPVAAYRTEGEQKKLYDEAVSGFVKAGYSTDVAQAMASSKVGLVNCSEHQLGLAVDFDPKDLSLKGISGDSFEAYLTANIHKFGYILSYPAGEEESTGHEANTCHYRYVGIEVATAMAEKRYTLAEYREYLTSQISYYKEQISYWEKK